MVTDFFDEMKSRSKGYASMEYQITGYRPNKLVRLDVKINQEVSDTTHCLGWKAPHDALHKEGMSGPLHHPQECLCRWQSPWHQLCTRTMPTELAGHWSPS